MLQLPKIWTFLDTIENLEERFNNLNVRYFIKAIQNDNEIEQLQTIFGEQNN
jgi:hypothetical protein